MVQSRKAKDAASGVGYKHSDVHSQDIELKTITSGNNPNPTDYYDGHPVTLTKGFYKCLKKEGKCKVNLHYHQVYPVKKSPKLVGAARRKAEQHKLCKEVRLCKSGAECYSDFPNHYHPGGKRSRFMQSDLSPEESILLGHKVDHRHLERSDIISLISDTSVTEETEVVASLVSADADESKCKEIGDYGSDDIIPWPYSVRSVDTETDYSTITSWSSDTTPIQSEQACTFKDSLLSLTYDRESEAPSRELLDMPVYFTRDDVQEDKNAQTIIASVCQYFIDAYRNLWYQASDRAPNLDHRTDLRALAIKRVDTLVNEKLYVPYWWTKLFWGKQFSRGMQGQIDHYDSMYTHVLFIKCDVKLYNSLLLECGTMATGNNAGESYAWCAHRVLDAARKLSPETFTYEDYETTVNTCMAIVNVLALKTTKYRDCLPKTSMSKATVKVVRSGQSLFGLDFQSSRSSLPFRQGDIA